MDAAVQYDDPYTGTSYILVIRNTLHVPNTQLNANALTIVCYVILSLFLHDILLASAFYWDFPLLALMTFNGIHCKI